MKRSLISFSTILSLMLVILFWPILVQPQASSPNLSISTIYPSQVAQLGESVSISIDVKTTDIAQTVEMSMGQIPEGWSATFRGGGRVVQSIFVELNCRSH